MIRVVCVKGFNRPDQRAEVCYVGRPFAGWKGHPLANPYRPDPIGRAVCLERYRNWLLARPRLEMDLATLWQETHYGTRPLGCWCVNATHGDGQPVVCHAQILAAMLAERFLEAKETA